METDNATPAKVLGGLSPNLFAELHGPDRLVVDPDVLDVYFTPSMTKNRKPLSRVVGIDGVSLDNALYLPEPGDLAKLQGRRVWILPDAGLADRIILCEQDGTAICHAYADKRAGATNEHRREARRRRERYKRVVRNYIPARDDSLLSDTSRILRVKRDYALAEERKLCAELGIEDQRSVRIVRPDLAESAKRLKSRERPRDGRRMRLDGASDARQNGFDILASDCPAPTEADIAERNALSMADVYGDEAGDAVDQSTELNLADVYTEAAG